MILPAASATTELYWRAASESRFTLRFCRGCNTWHHPRVSRCCAGSTLEWREAGGRGHLVSYTVVRRVLNPALEGQVPYTITLTRTEEGPQLLTSLPGDTHDLHVGAPMRVVFDRISECIGLPRFAPVAVGGSALKTPNDRFRFTVVGMSPLRSPGA